MKKQTLTSLILAGIILLCGCADQSDRGSSNSSSSPAESTSVTETVAATPEITEKAKSKYDYVHGTDGYYNLAEDMFFP